MAEHKTGALLGCALALGSRLAGAPDRTVTVLDRAGRHLGVAFQIADDVLGIWGDPAATGKPVHGDLRQGKKTLPVLAALNGPGARNWPNSSRSPTPWTTPLSVVRRPSSSGPGVARRPCGRLAATWPRRTGCSRTCPSSRGPRRNCAPCCPPSPTARSDTSA